MKRKLHRQVDDLEYFGVGEIGETDGKMGKYGDTIKNPADFVENM
jgi:hypothetical protein